MRIGVVCPYNIYKPGGVQAHVQAQVDILRKRGHTVFIITPRPYQRYDTPPDGVIFLGASARVKAPHATSADVSVSLSQEALESLDDLKLDLIHVHEPLVPFIARQILNYLTIPKVGTFHAALPGNVLGKSFAGSYKAYARSVLPHIDAITAVSPAAMGYIEDANEQPVRFIPNGIDLSVFKPDARIKRDPNLILFIGRLEKRKGAKQLLKAFELLKETRPELILQIAGDGPLRKSLENYVVSHEIENVDFLGYITEEEKYLLLQKASVFTSPALYGESFGIVLVEAMALGTPIVAHPNPGYEWVLQGPGRLSLADAEDEVAYARALQVMLEEDSVRNLWRKWALEYVKQFSYEKVVDGYEAVYQEVTKIRR